MQRISLLFSVIVLVFGCSSQKQSGNVIQGDGGSSVNLNGSGELIADCPAAPATDGDPCARANLACEYGDHPLSSCRVRTVCVSRHGSALAWERSDAQQNCEPLSATCSATLEMTEGASCTDGQGICEYNGRVCGCACGPLFPIARACAPTEKVWVCEPAQKTANCPAQRPRYGTACTQEGLLCHYGCTIGDDESRQCTDGAWTTTPSECPESSRNVKKDIHYLTSEELDQKAQDALAIRLATYEYKDPNQQRGLQIGFILEEAPNDALVTQDHQHVNLYAYTSLVLSAFQKQQKQIEALKKEIAMLKRKEHVRE